MTRKSPLRLAATVSLAALAFGLTDAAVAAPTTTEPWVQSFAAGEACSFELQVSGTNGRLRQLEFVDDTGHVLRVLSVTTGISYTYTNLATSQTVTTRAGGSAISSEMNPDGTWTYTATGHNGLILFPSDIPAGPTTTVYEGRIIFRVVAGGV